MIKIILSKKIGKGLTQKIILRNMKAIICTFNNSVAATANAIRIEKDKKIDRKVVKV